MSTVYCYMLSHHILFATYSLQTIGLSLVWYVVKTLVSGWKVLRRWRTSWRLCVCDLREREHDSWMKYVADHQCACSGTALWTVWVTMNICASVPMSQSMCLHVWERESMTFPIPFIWASCDVRCCVTLSGSVCVVSMNVCVELRESASDFVRA